MNLSTSAVAEVFAGYAFPQAGERVCEVRRYIAAVNASPDRRMTLPPIGGGVEWSVKCSAGRPKR